MTTLKTVDGFVLESLDVPGMYVSPEVRPGEIPGRDVTYSPFIYRTMGGAEAAVEEIEKQDSYARLKIVPCMVSLAFDVAKN